MKLRLLFAIGAVAAILMYWMMSHGPGISPDAIVYLDTARSILAGQGMVVAGLPMTHFPPVYPLLLAAIGLVDPDLLHAARLLGACLFGANVVLVGSAVYLACGRRMRPAACAVLLFAISASVIELHAMAWSEPPFFVFTLSGLLVLAAHVARPSRRLLVLAATSLGLAMATRYVGITLFPVLLFALWFMGKRLLRDRVRDTLVAVPVALAPIGAWLIRNATVSVGLTDRQFAWHLVNGDQFSELIGTLSDYVLPIPFGVFAQLALLVGLIILFDVMWRPVPGEPRSERYANLTGSLPALLIIYTATYIGFLLISISVADASTPLDDRLLFPVFGCMVVAAVVVGERFLRRSPPRWVRWGLLALVLLSLVRRIVPAERRVARVHRDGSEYSSDGWRGSPAIMWLDALSPSTVVFSNVSEAIGYLTTLRVLSLPDSISPFTLRPNPRFQVEMGTVCERVNAGRALVAYLTTDGAGDSSEQEVLEHHCAFRQVTPLPDGTIYGVVPPPTKPAAEPRD